MEEYTKENGARTRNKEKVGTFGQTDRFTTVTSRMTIAMASEFYTTQMASDLKDNGVKEKNMALVHTFSQTIPSTWLSTDTVKR